MKQHSFNLSFLVGLISAASISVAHANAQAQSVSPSIAQSGLYGVLHTDQSEQIEPYLLNVSLYNEWLPNQALFKGDTISDGWETQKVSYLMQTNHFLSIGLGLPYGLAFSSTLPFYYEDFQTNARSHEEWYLGDLKLKMAWFSPKYARIPWLSNSISVGTSLGTSSLGSGFAPREIEYALPEMGCHLGSCGSRNTGLNTGNLDMRVGSSVDFSKSHFAWPALIHLNLGERKTGIFGGKAGPYELKDKDFYDVFYWSIATEYQTQWHNLGVFTEYLNEARLHSEAPNSANKHDLSYGLSWQGLEQNALQAKVGLTHGLFNDGYARADHATAQGEDVWEYATKTPDLRIFAQVSLALNLAPDRDQDGVRDYKDDCKGTPVGVKVNAKGCELDSDNDLVVDSEDRCPNTPSGSKIDAQGCPIIEVVVQAPIIETPKVVEETPNVPVVPVTPVVETPKVVEVPQVVEVKKDPMPDLIALQKGIQFEKSADKIKESSFAILDQIANVLVQNPNIKLEIQGHTSREKPEYDANNLILSEKRALAVLNYLSSKGVDTSHFKSVGYGGSKPIATNKTDEGRKLNRRVEFVLIP